jgi:hypothetical protein
MMIFYGGGRREEYCGLMIDDLIEDNGAYPYLHIAKNKFRRIKNAQSTRNIVLHPEIIRLGFLRYVSIIRSLGYELVFPDLFSPTTKSPLGNRYYKLFKPVLITAGITEEGLGSHALRHAFGAILKKKHVPEELRADLLGHRGKSETSERYCEATEIATMAKLVRKMPIVTGHLVAHPINLPAWVTGKLTPPFSHPGRAKKTTSQIMALISTDQNLDERVSKVRFVPNGNGLVARFEAPGRESSSRTASAAPFEIGEHRRELSLGVDASRDHGIITIPVRLPRYLMPEWSEDDWSKLIARLASFIIL